MARLSKQKGREALFAAPHTKGIVSAGDTEQLCVILTVFPVRSVEAFTTDNVLYWIVFRGSALLLNLYCKEAYIFQYVHLSNELRHHVPIYLL